MNKLVIVNKAAEVKINNLNDSDRKKVKAARNSLEQNGLPPSLQSYEYPVIGTTLVLVCEINKENNIQVIEVIDLKNTK